MSDTPSFERLRAVLKEFGIRTADDRVLDGTSGFPVILQTDSGQRVCLDLPQPALLAALDPSEVGVAMLDNLGYVSQAWGLAKYNRFFDKHQNCLETEIGSLIESAYRGNPGALYLDGFRYYVSSVGTQDFIDVFVLVTSARDEESARRQATRSQRSADALKRVGKALTMNQNLHPLCSESVHEIASTTELAAVLLWTRATDADVLRLTANVGTNRQGTSVLAALDVEHGASCVAELVASTGQPIYCKSVYDNPISADLEAKFCYLRPGGLMVMPLMIGDRLIGVLELIGREGDQHFGEQQELFRTIAEHLALALNSAMMFESFEKLASFDPLTGIANHRSMQDFLHRRVSEAERTGIELGVIMLDVDHFRSFNEEEGHDAGDEVLKRVVEALNQCVRPYDMAARYGGEEFTVIMPGVGLAGTENVANRIREKIEQIQYVTRSGRIRHVTASLGCAVFPATCADPAGLLKAADTALFRAKRAGRNRVETYAGHFEDDLRHESIEPEAVVPFIHPDELDSSRNLLSSVKNSLPQLTDELGLSKTQERLLEALILITPTYRRLKRDGNEAEIQSLAKANEMRSLMPSLEAMDERFDGQGDMRLKGERIPLLARVVSALIALRLERGTPFGQDPGRFDPEIVSMVIDLPEAA